VRQPPHPLPRPARLCAGLLHDGAQRNAQGGQRQPALADRGLCRPPACVPAGGDDFKSGQTKMKSVLVDFLVGAGIKPTSIVSYNHLGNNDGMNLSAPQTFRSKEISKSNVVDDMVQSNSILYGCARG
jgi:hypothetical protein